MTRDQVEAVAEVLWLQTWNDRMGPFPETGRVREQFLKNAREVIYAYERTRQISRPLKGDQGDQS